MAKKIRKISKPAKYKFSPGFFYLILSLIVLILIVLFVNTSKISNRSKASERNPIIKSYTVSHTLIDCKKDFSNYQYASCDESSCYIKWVPLAKDSNKLGFLDVSRSDKICRQYVKYVDQFPAYGFDYKAYREQIGKPTDVYCCVSKR